MTQDHDLSGKTFDQQVEATGGKIQGRDIAPNRCIPGEVVFESMGNGVRVTARDAEHRVLWGYVGARETVRQIHCLVATYPALQEFLVEELAKRDLLVPDKRKEEENPIEAAQRALDSLEEALKWLRTSLKVKKVSDATLERAREIERIASGAERQILLEANAVKGMKSHTAKGAANASNRGLEQDEWV